MDLNKLWSKNTGALTNVMPEQTMGFGRSLWQAVQHLLTASGANILGPILMHLDPSMALFTSGIGTLVTTVLWVCRPIWAPLSATSPRSPT